MALPTVTPELVAAVAHNAYRLRLDSDGDRDKFDALPPVKQKSRTVAFEPLTRSVLLALGCPEPERRRAQTEEVA